MDWKYTVASGAMEVVMVLRQCIGRRCVKVMPRSMRIIVVNSIGPHVGAGGHFEAWRLPR